MQIQEQLQNLDQLLVEGKFTEAIERFFHTDLTFFADNDEPLHGKNTRLGLMNDFLATVQSIDQASLHQSLVDGEKTFSRFTFEFSQHDGNQLRWDEVIIRKWADGKVVEEQYITSGDIEAYFAAETELPRVLAADSIEVHEKEDEAPQDNALVAEASYEFTNGALTVIDHVNIDIPDNDPDGLEREIKVNETGAVKDLEVTIDINHTFRGDLTIELIAPSRKSVLLHSREGASRDDLKRIYSGNTLNGLLGTKAKGKWKLKVTDEASRDVGRLNWWKLWMEIEQVDDLKKIEGVGPKTAALLKEAGFYSFFSVANAKVSELQEVLDDAGPRYRIIDPTTWPEQARLAYLGKWDELKELQDELKGGKRVK